MFNVGDKIVYPMHGAGIIEDIEMKNILGKDRKYYILHIPYGDMKVMIPVDKTDEIGVRSILSESEILEVFDVLKGESTEMSDNWNRRNRENMGKLKTGDIFETAEVVRNLVRIEEVKPLSTGEKKLLSTAMQILASEIILIRNVSLDEAKNMVCEAVLV
ncbi:MAG: CarD family transcriptional regulator [Anaerovoracaceae bacterium]